MRFIRYQNGQVALIALLVLTIATTVGLSLITRTTTDVSVTRNIEESSRAFSAAEAGIEEALKSGIAASNVELDSGSGVRYSVTVASVNGTAANPYVFPQKTQNENTETVWLVDHDATTGVIIETPAYTANYIDVCWSSESIPPAVVVSVLYKTAGVYRVGKVAYDPAGRPNNFSVPTAMTGGCTGTSTTYRSRITFSDLSINPASDTIIALRIRPVYSGTLIAVAPAQPLPNQANRIESVGSTQDGVNRKIIVYQQYRAPESIFDYVIYSGGSFSQ